MKKKELENTLFSLIGIGLIVTSVVLLLRRTDIKKKVHHPGDDVPIRFKDYETDDHGLHVFSETGILL